MNEQNYTSLTLSKKLAENGCKLESEYIWVDSGKWTLEQAFMNWEGDVYPAYDILNDICVKYSMEFLVDIYSIDPWVDLNNYSMYLDIIRYLQIGEKDKAENALWQNCNFNPENK